MKLTNYILFCITAIFLLTMLACKKEKLNPTFDQISKDTYYTNDPFKGKPYSIYGKWKLTHTTGGFSGAGLGEAYLENNEFFLMKKNGIFGVLHNDSLIVHGKTEIVKDPHLADENKEAIRFISEEEIIWGFENREMVYMKIDEDELTLQMPCCDLYDFHYSRIE